MVQRGAVDEGAEVGGEVVGQEDVVAPARERVIELGGRGGGESREGACKWYGLAYAWLRARNCFLVLPFRRRFGLDENVRANVLDPGPLRHRRSGRTLQHAM